MPALTEGKQMTQVHILAIDLAKRSFQVCGTDRGGACVALLLGVGTRAVRTAPATRSPRPPRVHCEHQVAGLPVHSVVPPTRSRARPVGSSVARIRPRIVRAHGSAAERVCVPARLVPFRAPPQSVQTWSFPPPLSGGHDCGQQTKIHRSDKRRLLQVLEHSTILRTRLRGPQKPMS